MPLDRAESAPSFLDLHTSERPLLLPNAWDLGSAKLLAWLGFKALATTSSGFAASLGRLDGTVTREEALSHAVALGEATGLPINADLENCFADAPEGVAETVRRAAEAGIAACSVEDWSGSEIYDASLATERVGAAAQAAGSGSGRVVLTARAENLIHGRDDLDDTISRLVAYQGAGADVLFAPGLRSMDQIRAVLEAVDRPVNVLLWPGAPPVAELGEAGVSRLSIGGALAFAAYGTLVESAKTLLEEGTYAWFKRARIGFADGARQAFADG